MASTSPKHAINFQTGYLQPVRQSLLGVGSMQCGNGQGSRRQGQEWQSKLVSGLCEAETQRHGCCHCSVTQSCLTLWNPVNCSTPGFPGLHRLPELAQTHVHWVCDAIQPSHPLLPPFSCLQAFPASGSSPGMVELVIGREWQRAAKIPSPPPTFLLASDASPPGASASPSWSCTPCPAPSHGPTFIILLLPSFCLVLSSISTTPYKTALTTLSTLTTCFLKIGKLYPVFHSSFAGFFVSVFPLVQVHWLLFHLCILSWS